MPTHNCNVLKRLPTIKTIFVLLFFIVATCPVKSFAQQNANGQQLGYSQQFRLGQRIIRVAEPGQLADSINVWGDVNSAGRYLIPKGTSLPDLISYSFGPQTLRSNEAQLDWSKLRVEVNISEYSPKEGQETVKNFRYKFDEPLPQGMRNFELSNNQVVAIQVKRKPSFVDYVRVIAPVISAVATGFLIVDRL